MRTAGNTHAGWVGQRLTEVMNVRRSARAKRYVRKRGSHTDCRIPSKLTPHCWHHPIFVGGDTRLAGIHRWCMEGWARAGGRTSYWMSYSTSLHLQAHIHEICSANPVAVPKANKWTRCEPYNACLPCLPLLPLQLHDRSLTLSELCPTITNDNWGWPHNNMVNAKQCWEKMTRKK